MLGRAGGMADSFAGRLAAVWLSSSSRSSSGDGGLGRQVDEDDDERI